MTKTVTDPIKQTLLARVYDVIHETPLIKADKLSLKTGCNIYLKREDLQPVHSFKIRGAYNKMITISDMEKKKGVIAASAGNHAQGVALSAKKLGISAIIVMPTTTPSIKVDAVKSHGAEVVLHGDSFSDAFEHTKSIIKKSGRIFIHPFDDPLVIAGQGTIGKEIMEQLSDVTHIFVPVGGGGLLAGIAQYIKRLRPDIKVIGVEPEDSNVMQQSLKQNRRVSLKRVGIFADGVAVKEAGKHTFAICKEHVDDMLTVSTDEICAGIKSVFEDTRTVVEPAGALAAAAASKYGLDEDDVVVAICSGANLTFERLQQIAERTLYGSGKEALFSVHIPEKPGSLDKFCKEIVNGHGITSFSYRLTERSRAAILIGIGVSGDYDRNDFMKKMHIKNYDFIDLTTDDIAKEHVRHMIGGTAPNAESEHFYQINFPERPNALGDFLSELNSKWNISAFHYKSIASDVGNVLIGFEADDKHSLEGQLHKTGYAWNNIDKNSSLKNFIT